MPTAEAKNIVLELLASAEYSPLELLQKMRSEGMSGPEAKSVLAQLIEYDQVEMTNDRRIRAISVASASA